MDKILLSSPVRLPCGDSSASRCSHGDCNLDCAFGSCLGLRSSSGILARITRGWHQGCPTVSMLLVLTSTEYELCRTTKEQLRTERPNPNRMMAPNFQTGATSTTQTTISDRLAPNHFAPFTLASAPSVHGHLIGVYVIALRSAQSWVKPA